MSLYNIKPDTAAVAYGKTQFIITKFDDDCNVESTYLVSETACTCPAGVRPSCRHRKMLPRMMHQLGTGWFYDYETQKWHRPVEEPEMASDSATHLSPSDYGHQLYMTGDSDAPDVIKDRNGEVVLGLCRKCGRGEIELDSPCPSGPTLASAASSLDTTGGDDIVRHYDPTIPVADRFAGAAGSQHHSPSGSVHQIRCKRTGEGLAIMQGGGDCKCPSAKQCRVHPSTSPTPPVQGIRRRV